MPSATGSDPYSVLSGKRVVLGVCGGIAAYKAVELCRRLSDAGAHVSPVLTASATRFVGVLTFSALADEAAQVSMYDGPVPSPHIELAHKADLVVVAPATAHLMSAYATGASADLLTTTLIATRAPVLVCPAMHAEMWEHPAVQDNVATLRRRGVTVLCPAVGRLAGGDVGAGRLREPVEIIEAAVSLLGAAKPGGARLCGYRAVVSAGGTREPIDPVRFVGNRSSGRQGNAIAEALAAQGATVTLVTTSEMAPDADAGAPGSVSVVRVETAAEMAAQVLEEAKAAGVVVMAAAVADYTPRVVSTTKMKKGSGHLHIELVPTLDILSELGRHRRPGQVIVGFAAETASGGQLADLGRAKLEAKGADIILANQVGEPGTGFSGPNSRAVMVLWERTDDLGVADKRAIADKLVDAICQLLPGA